MIIGALPRRSAFLADLTGAPKLGDVLQNRAQPAMSIFQPPIVSLLLADGASAEIAVVDNEGMIGISLFMTVKPPQSGGGAKRRHAYRCRPRFLDNSRRSPQHLLPRFTGVDYADGADRGVQPASLVTNSCAAGC
jgi:hypothetical protein